ncbi:MAG: hypothetical protein MZV64_63175 [Ignavibacteriales bacterium]|nr:hypothetical protein [Ignavibacteriales bacterium]
MKVLDFGLAAVAPPRVAGGDVATARTAHARRPDVRRHARLHVARAAAGRAARPPHRRLLARRRPLRDGDRAGRPFEAKSAAELVAAILRDAPGPADAGCAPACPRRLDRLDRAAASRRSPRYRAARRPSTSR